MLFCSVVVLAVLGITVQAGDLCKTSEWYNDRTGSCHTCKVCAEKSWEMAPCLEFADTMCVDLAEMARDLNLKSQAHRWHEMEGGREAVESKEKVLMEKSSLKHFENLWGQMMLVALCMSFMTVAAVVVFLGLRYFGKAGNSAESRKQMLRSRLFSRDRLNTTEFMNNLATLDRRLALDEIVEKRKKAIFEPQLLAENGYSDDVFVDLSGLPRNLRDEHEYEELDHRKCLLQLKDEN